MANKPINRYEVQYCFGDGGYMRWTSRRGAAPLTPAELVEQLEKMIKLIKDNETVRSVPK